MTTFVRHNGNFLILKKEEYQSLEEKMINEIKCSEEFKNLNLKIVNEFVSKLGKHYNIYTNYDERFYANFFVNLKSLHSKTRGIKLNDKRKLNLHIKKQINTFLKERHDELSNLINKVVNNLYAILFDKKTDFSDIYIEEYDLNPLKEFVELILNSNEAKLFKDKFKDNFAIKHAEIFTLDDLNESTHNYGFLKQTDHIENIKNIFPKKGIIMFLYILKNKNFVKNLYQNKIESKNEISAIQHFLECSMNNRREFLNTLFLSPFFHHDHFKHAKTFIKQNFGLNNFGYKQLLSINLNIKTLIRFPEQFSLICLNNGIVPREKIEYYNFLSRKKTWEHQIEPFNFFTENCDFLKLLKEKLDPSKTLTHYPNEDHSEYFLNPEMPYFAEFIEKERNKTLFLKNVNIDYLNEGNHFDSSIYYNTGYYYDLVLKTQMTLGRIIPNLYLNKPKEHCLFFRNILFYFGKANMTLPNTQYNIFHQLYKEYTKLNPSKENLNSINKFLLEEFFESCSNNDDMFEEHHKLQLELDSSNKENINEIIELGENLIKKIGNIFYEKNIYSVYTFNSLIYVLTGVCFADYYPNHIFQSFCIELYLVHLFESHYQREFNINNPLDLKYISKFAEKYHSNYEHLLRKSFEYIQKKYDYFIHETCNLDASSVKLINGILKFNQIEDYNEDLKSLVINDFAFRPLIKIIDFINEGEIMDNCLLTKRYYREKTNSIVFSITHLKNKDFRANLTTDLLSKLMFMVSEGPFEKGNKKNKLFKEELDASVKTLITKLNDSYMKHNTNKEENDFQIENLTIN